MPKPVSVRAGQLEFLKLNLQSWGWRDAYQWFLGLNWPAFIVFIASIYIIINLLFAAFYSLGGNRIAGMRPGVSPSPTPTPTRLRPQLPRSYRVWGYPWTPLAFGLRYSRTAECNSAGRTGKNACVPLVRRCRACEQSPLPCYRPDALPLLR